MKISKSDVFLFVEVQIVFRFPVSGPPSHESPWCQTLCVHRRDGTLRDLGIRNWHALTRAQRVTKTIPSRFDTDHFR